MKNRNSVSTDAQQERTTRRTPGWTPVLDLGMPDGQPIDRARSTRAAVTGIGFVAMP